ncbi:hypothetical protein OH799_05490 [Nocardia sp. NBC_00881]|nr:hypothetical protein OH799_05490 [Nocardia sp. NBC_00881]
MSAGVRGVDPLMGADRVIALMILTLAGGLASTVFAPRHCCTR